MKNPDFSIGILSWNGYDSLLNSLKSYEKNGLSKLTNHKYICLPEYKTEGIKIAKSFSYEPILIKQNYLCSGLGNYLKSEILYDAKINPNKTIDKFSDKEIKDLYNSIIKICNIMLKNEGRDLKTLQVYERKKDKNGYDVKYEKTPDRKYTYWVPEVQK